MHQNLSTPEITFAENVALLHLLHRVPTKPKENSIGDFNIIEEGYILKFDREQNLVATLAFLCNTLKDTDHIPAVCVVQNRPAKRLDILLAVNKAGPRDGSQRLGELEVGLNDIFSKLAKVSNGSLEAGKGSGIEKIVFHSIISMCSNRILLRMGLARDERKSKKTIKELGILILSSLGKVPVRSSQQSALMLVFKKKLKALIGLVDSWSKHQIPTELQGLVEGVYDIHQIEGISEMISSIHNRLMDPSMRRSFINMTSKVSRYREAATFLYRTAKKFPVTRHMKVVSVNLDESSYKSNDSNYLQNYEPLLSKTMQRINQSKIQWDLKYLSRLLGTTSVQAQSKFSDQTSKTMKDAKIHAEVQLLYHCELENYRIPPRVICSSKKACYLCNALICMHKKIYMPKSHGRLYPKWRLPRVSQFQSFQSNFNVILEESIQDGIKLMLNRRQGTSYPDPSESTLHTLPISTSTLSNEAQSTKEQLHQLPGGGNVDHHEPIEHEAIKHEEIEHEDIEHEDIQHEAFQSDSKKSQLLNITVPEEIGHTIPLIKSCQIMNQSSPTTRTISENNELVKGQKLCKNARDGLVQFHRAGKLEVFIEHSTESTQASLDRNIEKFGYRIRWLSDEEVKMVTKNQSSSIINVELAYNEISWIIDSGEKIYFTGAGSVLEFSFMRAGEYSSEDIVKV